MAEIQMPSLGADMEAGTLVEWKVAVGDRVARGDVVGLIETQKATMELESFVEGIVEAILVEAGTKVPVGTALARLGDAVASVRSSPAARKRARELGVDLSSVQGSGPHGAIILRDVRAPEPVPSRPAPAVPRSVASSSSTSMRDAIAVSMSRAKREIPHYYLAHPISLKRALAWLDEHNRERSVHDRVLPGAVLLRAVAVALRDFPELNGFYREDGFHAVEEVHLATAISLRTGGLIAPAILDADEKPLDELMRELADLVIRARGGHLRSSELTSATITVTSLGERGCEVVFPIIDPPQVAIVGFGAVADRPWVEAGAVVAHPVVYATLSADHRVSDGHRGGLFLAALDRALQEPQKL
jgi:pyruvate dehydrogenase E2 component (dihydrolipoamide acetyltransferase)